MDTLLSDLRYALRSLAKHRLFALVVIVTLGLGIGANAAIFTVVDAALLRPLPFAEPDRLVLIWGRNARADLPVAPHSYPAFADLRARSRSFTGMAAWVSLGDTKFSLTGIDEPEKVQYAVASANLFSVLGVAPRMGRTFFAREDERGTPPVVIVSHALWRRHFGEARSIAGKTLVLDGTPYEVVGVLPPGFRFVSYPREPDVWIPFGLDPFRDRQYARGARALGIVARLATGVTLERAAADLARVQTGLAREDPRFSGGWSLDLVPLREQAVGEVRTALLVLLGAVALVLLIGCANVANVLLARAAAREQEMAVRAALGAGRSRLVRQLLTESLVLAAAGGALGVLLAVWGSVLPAAVALAPGSLFTPVTVGADDIGVNTRVLAFTATLTLGTGLLFGLLPAWRGSRADLLDRLKQGTAGGGGSRAGGRLSSALVVVQVSLALTLLVGAGLLIRSFARLTSQSPGFHADNVLTLELDLAPSRYRSPDEVGAFYARLLERATALPGVRAVGAVEQLPFMGPAQRTDLRIAGHPEPDAGSEPRAVYGSVSPGYFEALGIRLLRGRGFSEHDNASAPRVVIINEALAKRYWPGQDPIGQRLALSTEALRFDRAGPPRLDFPSAMRDVVGVVEDVKRDGLADAPLPEAYVPVAQRPVTDMTLALRTSGDPLALSSAVRALVRELDPEQPVSSIQSMARIVSLSVGLPRARTLLLSAIAVLAAVLASLGIYGVIAFGIAERTREIGIRIALGAAPRDVVRLIVRRGITLALVGTAAGLLLAAAASRALGSLLFTVTPRDPITLAAGATLVLAAAFAASWIPARRAARISPTIAMRE